MVKTWGLGNSRCDLKVAGIWRALPKMLLLNDRNNLQKLPTRSAVLAGAADLSGKSQALSGWHTKRSAQLKDQKRFPRGHGQLHKDSRWISMTRPGFKGEARKFQEYLDQEQPSEGQTGTQAVSFAEHSGRCASEGRYRHHQRAVDLAINGQAYFVVQTVRAAAAISRLTKRPHQARRRSGAGASPSRPHGDIHIRRRRSAACRNRQSSIVDC